MQVSSKMNETGFVCVHLVLPAQIGIINNKHIPVSQYSDMSSSRVKRQYTKCSWTNQDAFLRSIIRAVASLPYNHIIFCEGVLHVFRHPYVAREHTCM